MKLHTLVSPLANPNSFTERYCSFSYQKIVALNLNVFHQHSEDTETGSSVKSQKEDYYIIFFKMSFMNLTEGLHKISCFSFQD